MHLGNVIERNFRFFAACHKELLYLQIGHLRLNSCLVKASIAFENDTCTNFPLNVCQIYRFIQKLIINIEQTFKTILENKLII